MPVSVPRQTKSQAHPVDKSSQRASSRTILSQCVTGSLPVPPLGPPPSFGTRAEWLSSLPSWRRNKQRLYSDEAGLPPQLLETQDFYLGLAAAANAPVIKGPHAEACIPPMNNLLERHQEVPRNARHFDQCVAQFDMDAEMSTAYTIANQHQWDATLLASRDAVDAMVEDQPHGFTSNSSPVEYLTDSANHNRSYQSGAFSPIFEDQSPGSASGPETGSSPLEPLTPFGEFVDRAVAHAQHTTVDNLHAERSIIPDYYQTTKQPVFDAYQVAPVYPSIADEPNQQDPLADTIAPTTTVGYKKLSQPLSEWVAVYVWKVCTTGFSLPSAFARPAMNAGAFAVSVPDYLAPSIHSLLLSTLLQPSAVFLAVWYIARLPVYFAAAPLGEEFVKENAFRAALLGDGNGVLEHRSADESPAFRMVVLGCMLANKWLDDHTFSNKTWHSISNIAVQTLNSLESLALDIFNYDLSISNQQWSQWLSHVLSYHLSLSSPSYPQPIGRPSSNPHSIVRRSIEEIIHVPTNVKSACNVPQPVFLGIEERLRERAEKEQALAMDLEIDLDEDGPLREEYLPKRRASKLASQNAQTLNGQVADKLPPVKSLPPPAKWSPAGDEPILRDRNRSNGHYVAVQAPPLTTSTYPACQLRDVAYNQNWNPVGYMPVKQQTAGYAYDIPNVFGGGYNPFAHVFVQPPHSRSLSLSYDQDTLLPHNHMRSYSQSRFEYKCGDLQMAENAPIHESESRWRDAAGHYPYHGPAYIHIPAVGMQPAW
ncbi:hypothetical protein CVT25_008690 [Psilocybe cyanescens]|uniref:Uncharacterized protein n=1 Tax=Psilocybe cyanescens TaxID=93625 RepID=A0A409XNQ1_PSICY|nr:hypothetical protein CVT25_008690 [Psilocybe cyanescens]